MNNKRKSSTRANAPSILLRSSWKMSFLYPHSLIVTTKLHKQCFWTRDSPPPPPPVSLLLRILKDMPSQKSTQKCGHPHRFFLSTAVIHNGSGGYASLPNFLWTPCGCFITPWQYFASLALLLLFFSSFMNRWVYPDKSFISAVSAKWKCRNCRPSPTPVFSIAAQHFKQIQFFSLKYETIVFGGWGGHFPGHSQALSLRFQGA